MEWIGKVEVYELKKDAPEWVLIFEGNNLIMNTGKNRLAACLDRNNANSVQLKYMAFGTSNAAENAAHTTLTAESGRKATSTCAAGSTGVWTTNCYLGPNDANGITIEELGWFSPNAVYPDPSGNGQGDMIARKLFNYVKTSATSIIVKRTDTIA